ncbi:SDR family NAD(P)-dependent oxidoreductase [Candidatus Poriferisocius sp.]|uniref:SDR family NAD(P)-dependent oxidoreductase n=1 Tax=Candidatus Poriferisocius sp. TaxID=3101276 RepID=UPI003B02355C
MDDFSGKVALVMGAACPPEIGRAVAVRLAQAGADVACADRVEIGQPDTACASPEALDATVEAVRTEGQAALRLEADVSDASQVNETVGRCVSELGRLDLVVNVAGGLGPEMGWAPLLELSEASWRRSTDVNLTGAFLVAQAAARQMVEQGDGGSIVLLSSYATVAAATGTSAFAAAKAGVDRLVAALAMELAPHQIRVNGVRPLGVDPDATASGHPYLEQTVAQSGGDRSKWVRSKIALERLQHPDETAAVIAFLLSDEASFITGECITVAGGSRW